MSTAVIKESEGLTFFPPSFPDCNLWLDATDVSTTTLSGTNVTRWNDKSGLRNDGVTNGGTTTVSSINSVRALSFNGTSDFTGSISNNTPRVTAFMVATMTGSTASYGRLLSCGSTTQADTGANSVTLLNRLVTTTSVYSTSAGVNTAIYNFGYNVPGILVTQYTGTQGLAFLNGVRQGNPSNVTTSYNYVRYRVGNTAGNGSNGRWGGLVGEIIIYHASLTTSQREIVEGYLAWKWGLTANLPTTHPFKTRPPNVIPPQPSVSLSFPLSARRSAFADPTSLGNCVLWMDASDRSKGSMVVNAAGTVTSWFSKANTNTLASLGTIQSPGSIGTNGLSTISIVRNAQPVFTNVLGFGGNTAQTNVMLAFVPVNAVSAVLGIIRYFTAAGGNAFGLSLGTDIRYNSIAAYQNQGGASVTLTTSSRAQMAIIMQSGTTQSLFESGTAGNTVNYTLNQIDGRPRISYFASGAVANCELGELIIFSKALSLSERQYIEGYLAWKWGLTANLSPAHPYKNSPLGFPNPPISQPRRLVSSKWIPTNLSGCFLWLDGGDSRQVGVSDSNVTAWNDKSGLNNNLTTISTPAPTYNPATGAITFTGADGINVGTSIRGSLNTNYTNPMSTFIVCSIRLDPNAIYNPRLLNFGTDGSTSRYLAGQANYVLNAFTGSTPAFQVYANNGQDPTGQGTNVQTYIPTTFSTIGIFENISNYSGNTLTLNTFLNGNTSTHSSRTTTWTVALPYLTSISYVALGTNTNGSTYVGDDFSGDIYEVLCFSRELSVSDRQTVEGYLAWKWKLVDKLSPAHPYKLFPPPPK